MPRDPNTLAVPPEFLAQLWNHARSHLTAQLGHRSPEAIFLEGSIAEGFGNARSDVDFVALVDDGTQVATMPYILFAEGRRIEVRLLSRKRLQRELTELASALAGGLHQPSSRISWNQLERCQRFMHCLPIAGEAYIRRLQDELTVPHLEKIVTGWFADFAREACRYALAMAFLGQPEQARAWLRTGVFHAAKSYVATRGEHYLGSKWLGPQMDRCTMDARLKARVRAVLFASKPAPPLETQLAACLRLLPELGVYGVEERPRVVSLGRAPEVSTWQIGENVHVLRGSDVYRLGPGATAAWRSITFERPCLDVQLTEAEAQRRSHIAQFARSGLVRLLYDGQVIRAGVSNESQPQVLTGEPFITADGMRLVQGGSELQLLPLPAVRFAEAGVNLTWAHIGVENSREDSLGAFKKQQWSVLEYTLSRMIQASCLVLLAAHGVTPQVPLEDACHAAIRLLKLDTELIEAIREIESTPIASEQEARVLFELANGVSQQLRRLAGETSFPESFENAAGWRDTILYGYDWFNLACHLNATFPASAVGGRGTAEEARDLLASNLS